MGLNQPTTRPTNSLPNRINFRNMPRSMKAKFLLALVPFFLANTIHGASANSETNRIDPDLAEYFRAETKKISDACLADIQTLDDWTSRREKYRQQLLDMLGLWPLREKSDLKPVVTGKIERPDFTVEKLHFQSSPGLYVTANLYLPKNLLKPAPAILYVCGHSAVVSNGVSYGTKAAYQHHGIWFARNGYVCLVVDTLESGEILGNHHGTYRDGMWWWNSRGYTPAGVETWNNIRALDYLSTRSEVDTNRFGVTGRSGGGAYSWYLAAVDDRVKCAAPVAGITDLHNHVVDGAVEGHCDCMFMVNTYRWDYPQVAAMVAPRPLLIGNSDKDSIFPLDGVQRLHARVRRIYDLYKAGDKLGLLITEGPHKDTQDLQLPVFRWFNRHLKGEDPVIEMAATRQFTPQELKVFAQLPTDQINTRIHELFVPEFRAPLAPKNAADWKTLSENWKNELHEKVFRGWPQENAPLNLKLASAVKKDGFRLSTYEFSSQPDLPLRLWVMAPEKMTECDLVTLCFAGEEEKAEATARVGWAFPSDFAADPQARKSTNDVDAADLLEEKRAVAFFLPREVNFRPPRSPKLAVQIRRRFMLLGQTLDSMQVWDMRRAIQAVAAIETLRPKRVEVFASHRTAANAAYAALFESVASVELLKPFSKIEQMPDYLNVARILNLPAELALVAENHNVVVHDPPSDFKFVQDVRSALRWKSSRVSFIAPGE